MKRHSFHTKITDLKSEVLHILDLVPLSTSSVAPTFSIAAAYGVMVSLAGPQAIMATFLTAVPFLLVALIFRQFNLHFPHAGASYHWGCKILGKKFGAFQAWVVTLAYFLSIPPIVIPAGEYTLALFYSLGLIQYSVYSSQFWVSVVGIIWVLIAAIPLMLGAKPTARFTEAFLITELIVLGLFLGLGFANFKVVNPFSWSWFFSTKVNWTGLVLAMIVAATIVDGWEIDSYASEESKRPRRWPGLSGIIGLLSVLLIYSVTMPLMTIETPLKPLAQSVDPLFTWTQYVVPSYSWLMDIAVLTSTASSLWLTAFILSRAWYAMARDKLLPSFFGWVHERFKSPWSSILLISGLNVLVNVLMLISPSVESFFTLLLSAAGIFLAMEFFLDSVSGVLFFWIKHTPMGKEKLSPHIHWAYRVVSIIASLSLGAIIALGLFYSPSTIGGDFPYVFAGLMTFSIPFIYLSRKMEVKEFAA
ncbi:amino acid permease [Sulfolobus sp. A20]|uniref:APC family permease n=1 Tax=Sulfolobaceae TaxID=118883 RepID=UPI00084609CD|nr:MULTISPECIES: APC family permease [unclassified Sulfolobus]TRM76965.1 APC family permease [Sulfolobus sp. A20-N-F8]TRM79532.1 APC family permease [Sulfolobus sp. B5]TRM82290.1 APC family permease [Sulfolobus sp. D5]TRM87816.1 APC family permease [Sulfolobus sp. E3]TRN00713.1 APC family permease [Sulfolobus sp. E1]TRN00737.1 APC family permease [Sulfolobus sp. F1]